LAELVPAPGSVAWRYAGDVRLLSTGAFAILLQVAHPTVGAGVSEHSDFRADPWGRLLRTLDYTYSMTYGGAELAGETGRRIREMHKQIKGVRDGERYHALEPEAYAWVHATLAHSIVRGHQLLGRPMSEARIECFYEEWRRSGRLIGLRERDLPEGWPEFCSYFERMTAERLERTQAVGEVLEALENPAPPPLGSLPRSAWLLARIPAGPPDRVDHGRPPRPGPAQAARRPLGPGPGARAAAVGGRLPCRHAGPAAHASQRRAELPAMAPTG
jgi:uncharacterized protein (DUF2236 family)